MLNFKKRFPTFNRELCQHYHCSKNKDMILQAMSIRLGQYPEIFDPLIDSLVTGSQSPSIFDRFISFRPTPSRRDDEHRIVALISVVSLYPLILFQMEFETISKNGDIRPGPTRKWPMNPNDVTFFYGHSQLISKASTFKLVTVPLFVEGLWFFNWNICCVNGHKAILSLISKFSPIPYHLNMNKYIKVYNLCSNKKLL
jgi:hypothetical protein